MNDTPDTRELEKQLALVKKDMEIMKADLSATLEGFRTDMATAREEAAKRETRLILVMAGMITAAVAVLGILIRWPAPPV